MSKQITGHYLNELWKVGASHALYSVDGTWYHQLNSFPGALFDSQGYVVFATESEFRQCPQLRISQDVGCPDGIRMIPGYIRVGKLVSTDTSEPSQPDRVRQTVSRIVRDTALSQAIKLLYKNTCQICGSCVDLGCRTYSEAHHIRPLGSPHDGPDERANLICVCPTCHVLLDYAAYHLEVNELKTVWHKISEDHVAYHNHLHAERAKPEGY